MTSYQVEGEQFKQSEEEKQPYVEQIRSILTKILADSKSWKQSDESTKQKAISQNGRDLLLIITNLVPDSLSTSE